MRRLKIFAVLALATLLLTACNSSVSSPSSDSSSEETQSAIAAADEQVAALKIYFFAVVEAFNDILNNASVNEKSDSEGNITACTYTDSHGCTVDYTAGDNYSDTHDVIFKTHDYDLEINGTKYAVSDVNGTAEFYYDSDAVSCEFDISMTCSDVAVEAVLSLEATFTADGNGIAGFTGSCSCSIDGTNYSFTTDQIRDMFAEAFGISTT